jgi:hypothetical protein
MTEPETCPACETENLIEPGCDWTCQACGQHYRCEEVWTYTPLEDTISPCKTR